MEVHFTLRHYFISSDSYDSFNGVIEQILVLQPGELPPQTVYKRKNVREGPIRMNPTSAAHQPTPTHAPTAAPIAVPVVVPPAYPVASGSNTSFVMTTRDYDSDANFFSYYFPITTPSAPACTITRLCSSFAFSLFSFCHLPCTLTTASPPQPGS